MKNRAMRRALALCSMVLVSAVVAGCNGNSPPLSKEEQANFKGGAMPESARQIMQQKMQEAQAKGGGGAPGAPPGTPGPTGPAGPPATGTP